MKAERLIFKNTLILGVGKGIGDVATFLFLIYFSRSYGQSALGQYSFAMATGGLLSIFVSLGLNTYTIREISKDKRRDQEYVGQLFVLRSICALVAWGSIWLIALIMEAGPEQRLILLIIGAYHFLERLAGIFNAGFMAHEEMLSPTLLGIVERIIILAAGSAGIYFAFSPATILAVYPTSTAIVLIATVAIYRKRHGWPLFRFSYPFIKKAVREASPFLVIIILSQFYDRIGLIILTAIKGATDTGIYTAGDRLLATINGFSVLFATAIFPSVSRLSEGSSDDLERVCTWAMRMVFIALFPLAVAIFIASDQIIHVAFGEGFADSAIMLRIACWSLVLFGFNRILALLMIANYKQGQLVRIRIAAYVFYFVISLLLVWHYSYLGLAWAQTITEGALFLATSYFAGKLNPAVDTLKRFFWPTLVCVVPTIALDLAGIDSVLIMVFFLVLFASTGAYFAVIRKDDLRLLLPRLVRLMGNRPSDDK